MRAGFPQSGTGASAALEVPGDATATALIGFLHAEGAGQAPHGGGRTLLDHLTETYHIVRRWGAPEWLQHAALIHSVYGTDAYHRQLLPSTRRDEVASISGPGAERVAFLFSAMPRGPLLAGTHTWMRSLPGNADDAQADAAAETAARPELDALVLLHLANLAEQARAKDGSPALWLVRLRDIGECLLDSETIVLPAFFAQLSSLTPEEEALARHSYLSGQRDDKDPDARTSALGLAAALVPVLPEPCVWLSYLARRNGDLGGARRWAHVALKRLGELGTVWDKRLSYGQWRSLAESLGGVDHDPVFPSDLISDPRRLYEESVRRVAEYRVRGSGRSGAREVGAGAARFHRYVATLKDGDDAVLGRVYPELESRPWYEPREFPLAVYLEANFPAIQREVRALGRSGFHPESEAIPRSGEWDVSFFYERGRRHDELCAACPVITKGIEAYPAMRTIAGLAYLSRMRSGTHIAPHRGPTNLRLRCHLGLEVPSGDCAIRVGDETRRWETGRCLAFDDFFEHEAWNHTDEDRIVLIVDLWHPALTAAEVRLLEGLHGYTYAHARKLSGYWAANAAARRGSAED